MIFRYISRRFSIGKRLIARRHCYIVLFSLPSRRLSTTDCFEEGTTTRWYVIGTARTAFESASRHGPAGPTSGFPIGNYCPEVFETEKPLRVLLKCFFFFPTSNRWKLRSPSRRFVREYYRLNETTGKKKKNRVVWVIEEALRGMTIK